MAANRYGQIWHGDHHHINIRFPSAEARLKFQNEFEEHHASHDHDGDIPTFKCATTKDLKLSTGDRRPQDLVKAESDKDYRITIDGYSWNEIHDYHNPSGYRDYSWYHVPTCCVPPTIVIDREFVDSGTLQRHKLSTLFTDMIDDDFKKLCASIEANGFIEPVIRLYEGKILDGWHRYRAAKELNLIRKLKFQEWNERQDGDPAAFVLARNIERRHLTPGQRGVIVVEMNNWLERGNVKSQTDSDSPNGEPKPKSRTELAKEAGVGARTIDRAKEVSLAGKAGQVIAGEKTVGEVINEQKAEKDNEREAAIAVLKPRFQNAVEKWRFSQVERLRKFERLPVGRTPLLESEYIKTYFELADPRIPQNTKPTAAHYEGAIECMQERPVAFAEQLEGRHYRKIIEEWDESVLPQLIKRFQGPLLGYQASQLKADAFEVRIRQAIREQYEFQGRIRSQPFEVLFEITEDAHAVLIQLNPKEWVRDGREISWAMSVLPEPIETPAAAKETVSREKPASNVVSEETVKRLWEQITAEMQEWKQRHTGVIYASKSVLLDAYREQKESDRKGPATVAELTGILKLMDEDRRAYALRVRYLRSDLRNAFETAQTEYFKARADLTAFINEKEISLSDFIEATKTQYHRTNVAEMFGQPSDIRKDSTLTTGVFEDWTGFMRVLYVDVKAPAAWVPTPKETEQVEDAPSENESYPLQDALDEMKAKTPDATDREASKLLKQTKPIKRPAAEDSEPKQAASKGDTADTPDYEKIQEEHIKRLKALPGEIREYIPKWIAANPVRAERFDGKKVTLKLLLNARCQIKFGRERGSDPFFREEMEELLNDMRSNKPALIEKVHALLLDSQEVPAASEKVDAQDEGEAEQDPFHDVDLATMKADLQVLIKKVMPAEKHPLYHQICEDIHDAYLDYENLPNDREIFAILLDCALTAIDELT